MKLWEYLRKKMRPYADRIAFAGLGISYGELLSLEKTPRGRGALRACAGSQREGQALEIIKCIAEGDVAVPASSEYGEKQFSHILETVREEEQVYGDLAFVMFTSGTTGKPKGVMLTDENIIANLEYITSYFDLKGSKSICIGRPLLHIAVLTGELLYGLINGLTIYFYEESFMPNRLLSYLREKEIEVFCATPTLYTFLANCPSKTASIKIGALSGERLTENAAKRIAESFPQTEFYNVYGLTEHSPRVSALRPKDFIRKAGSVGKPMGGVELKIQNGELLVKSPCVMKGYYRDERGTAEKIREGWLYTGDAGHADEEGYYYVEGRMDEMIIRAGVNIFPQEIENVLKDCPGVDDCLAYGQDDERYGQSIGLKYEGSIEEQGVREYLVRNLPPHLLPKRVERVDTLPRTASGKKVRRCGKRL